ncbi:NAD synthetase [Streptococcus pneumoniae]|nr:NAD synthetase [Streptococcus pneumoniae]
MTLQEQIMKALHVQPVIDPKAEIRKRVDFLKDYVKKTGAKGRKDLYLELVADKTLH